MKEAKTKYNIHELIRKRWSIRAFSGQKVSKENMHALMEAASWAPSASNEQPWRYQYAHKNSDGFNALWNCLLPGNQPWTADAAVLLVSIAKKNVHKNGKPNRHYMHDCGLANENLLLQAISMDIYGHPMAGFDIEKTMQTLKLQEDEEPVCFIAIGYIGDAAKLDEPYKSRETEERTRKGIDEISQDISDGIFQ